MLSRRVLGGVVLAGVLAGCVKVGVDAPPVSPVFFTSFSAELDGDALRVIGHVVDDARANPARSVIVEGFADQVGSAAANKKLSELRAQVVADALVARGVDRRRIVLRPRGATKSDPGIESRRVDISFGA